MLREGSCEGMSAATDKIPLLIVKIPRVTVGKIAAWTPSGTEGFKAEC